MDSNSAVDSLANSIVAFFEIIGEPLFLIGNTPITIVSLFTCGVIIVIAFIASSILQRFLTRFYIKRKIDIGVQHALNRLLHYLIVGLGIFLAIDNMGISLTALAAVAGVLLVGIGFGLQGIAKDFISGVILLIERPVRKGDYIEVDGIGGTVQGIRMRATVINTYDDTQIIIPNGKLINEVVLNRTLEMGYYRIRINVRVAYGSDPELVRQTLLNVANKHPKILDTPEPTVYFENFKESHLNFRLMGWVSTPHIEPGIRSDLHFGVEKAFRDTRIEIPYPQLNLHLADGQGKLQND